MADKWDRSIKGDFKRAHDGKTAPPSEQKTRNASDYSKLNHLKDGPKPPLPKRPTPAPAPGQTMGSVPAPQKAQSLHARWESADKNRKSAKDFSLKKEFNGKSR